MIIQYFEKAEYSAFFIMSRYSIVAVQILIKSSSITAID